MQTATVQPTGSEAINMDADTPDSQVSVIYRPIFQNSYMDNIVWSYTGDQHH